MQIIKQIFVEAFFRRKMNKGFVIKDFLFLICLLLSVCVLKSPMLVFMVFVMSINMMKWSMDKRKMPEGISFVPMSQKEMQYFVLMKSNLIAICSVIALWISYGLAIDNLTFSIDNRVYEFHELSIEFIIYHGVNIFGFIHLMVIITETARMRGVKESGITQWVYSLKGSLVFAVYIILSGVLFFWLSIRVSYDFENIFIPTIERIIVIIGLIGQYMAYHYLKKNVLQEFIYGDYNARIARNQEVDYEY